MLYYATSLTSIHRSVHLSVMLMDCDHTVQQKVEIGTRRDRLSACWSWPRSQYLVFL